MSGREFTAKEKKFIIKCLITKISLTTKRATVVEIRLNKFGTIHSHRNKKRLSKLKYLRRYNRESWKEKRKKDINNLDFLLW